MLYILTGDDFDTISQKKERILSSLHNKRPQAQEINLQADTAGILSILEEQQNSIGLFDDKSIIIGSGVCENIEAKDYILKQAHALHTSDNAFVLYEPTLNKKDITTLEKKGAVVYQYTNKKSQSPNLFYLADLLCTKNKSALWAQYQHHMYNGVSAEEIFSILTFQARALHLTTTRSQSDSGLKSFVYSKSKKSPWTAQEAQQLHHKLISSYHQSRRGGLDLATRIEQIILKLPK